MALRNQNDFCSKLCDSRITFVESSSKAGWLSLKAFQKQDQYVFCWELHKNRMAFVESSTKAELLLLKALRKQDGFRWKLYESMITFVEEGRMTFVESSTKTVWLLLKALRKQDQEDFHWKLNESRMTFVESSLKAGWLLFKALWKPFKKRIHCDNTKFRDNIAYVGGPSFCGRPWPFCERRSRNIWHPAQL